MNNPRLPRRAIRLGALGAFLWLGVAVWNSIKPMPPGTHVASLPARLAESQVDLLIGDSRGTLLTRELRLVGRAEQTVVIDHTPIGAELADALLLRKRQRPNLKILLVTDPRGELYGGTPAAILTALERAGIVVVRVRLERLRDSDPLYSSAWRLLVAWWDDPFVAVSGKATLQSELRGRNLKADRRQLLVTDDGAGAWISIIAAGATGPGTTVGVEVRGPIARDIVASELRIAAWSADEDRLPGTPPVDHRGVGAIDARLITEGAIQTALRDAIAVSKPGDRVCIATSEFGDRALVASLRSAAARGVRLQLLLDPAAPGTRAAAGELKQETGVIEVRWLAAASMAHWGYALIQHGTDIWIDVGSADFTRRSLDDLNLTADVELHLPARAGPARALLEHFAGDWSQATAYETHAEEASGTYWRYRLAEATGSAIF